MARRLMVLVLVATLAAACSARDDDPPPAPTPSSPSAAPSSPSAVPSSAVPSSAVPSSPVAATGGPGLEGVDWTKVVDDLDCDPANLGVELIKVRYADIRGQGRPDAYVQVVCRHEQSTWPHQLEVFDGASDPAAPKRLGVLVRDDEHLLIKDVTFGRSSVTVKAAGYSDRDPLCCPSIPVSRTFRWADDAFTQR